MLFQNINKMQYKISSKNTQTKFLCETHNAKFVTYAFIAYYSLSLHKTTFFNNNYKNIPFLDYSNHSWINTKRISN